MSKLLRALPILLFLLISIAIAVSVTARAKDIVVELELVLAVDTSASISDGEYRLQMAGIAHAFRDPDVIAAIESFGSAGIAVSMIHWSAAATRVTSWSHIVDASGSFDYAARVEAIGRTSRWRLGVTTAIGTALALAQSEISTNGFIGRRRSIDVSGDGRNNSGLLLWVEKERATSAGTTINGLAILHQDPSLLRYYNDQVIGGTGAFVMMAADFEDFARAFRQKLLQEIRAPVSLKQHRFPYKNFAGR